MFGLVTPAVASGIFTYSRSDLQVLVIALRVNQPANAAMCRIAREMGDLPLFNWIETPVEGDQPAQIRLSAETVAFWTGGEDWDPSQRMNGRSFYKTLLHGIKERIPSDD